VLETIVLSVRALALACRGHHELVLENSALRQQLGAIKTHDEASAPPDARPLFWMGLAGAWRRWRTALMIVQPETVMRWHHDWLRRRRTRRSTRTRCGRAPIDGEIRTLVGKMVHSDAWPDCVAVIADGGPQRGVRGSAVNG